MYTARVRLLVSIPFVASLCVLGPGVALAQDSPAAPAPPTAPEPTADASLFEEGRAAYARGDFALACQKFRAAADLKPSVGTLLNLANCQERIQHLASAQLTWQRAAQTAESSGDERATYAKQRLSQLSVRVPSLTFYAPSTGEQVEVWVDGARLPGFGQPLQLDPGEHRVEVRARGRAPRIFPLFLMQGEHRRLAAQPSPDAAGTGPPPTPAQATPAAQTGPTAPSPAAETRGQSQPGATALLIGGGAGIALSLVAGLLVLDAKGTVEDGCDSHKLCSPGALEAAARGRTWSTVATVTFIAGAAATGAGVTLLLLPPDAPGDKRAWGVGVHGAL